MSFIKDIPPLQGNNYIEWWRKIDLAFTLAEVDYVISTPCPTAPVALVREDKETYEAWQNRQRDFAPIQSSHDLEHKKWTIDNKNCLTAIKNTIEPALVGSIRECETASEYLKRIKNQFTSSIKIYAT